VLDIRTLFLAAGLMRLVQVIALFYVWRVHKNYGPARDWALGSLLVAAGMLLIALHDVISLDCSVIGGNLGLLGGAMLFDAGIVRACERRPPWAAGWTVLTAAMLLLAWFTIGRPSYAARSAILTSVVFVCHFYTVWTCLRVPRGPLRGTQWLVAGALAVEAVAGLVRCVDLVEHGVPGVLAESQTVAVFLLTVMSMTLLIVVALVNLTGQRLRIELDHAAQHDPLTGALNRRAFGALAGRELSRADRRAQVLSAIMLDLDHFKQVNDAHGHAAGDTVLVTVAHLVRAGLRLEDLLCRCGGEEFVAFLPDTTALQAECLAERLRETVAKTPVCHAGVVVPVTISIGVAERRRGDQGWEELMAAADKALYRAKSEGRNRVVVLEPARASAKAGGTIAAAHPA
jgi:diguanylate cyclase (GGDEF)-like protein